MNTFCEHHKNSIKFGRMYSGMIAQAFAVKYWGTRQIGQALPSKIKRIIVSRIFL
jgi:hypothetical protein